jgi:hypothetical protein
VVVRQLPIAPLLQRCGESVAQLGLTFSQVTCFPGIGEYIEQRSLRSFVCDHVLPATTLHHCVGHCIRAMDVKKQQLFIGRRALWSEYINALKVRVPRQSNQT